jgi:glucose 1-dehydrogenase
VTRFAGQVGIITGASSGIGRAAAEQLAAEGASLVLVAAPTDGDALREVAEALAAGGTATRTLAADVSEEATAIEAVRLAVEELGGLQLLVNNAGITYFDDVFDAPLAHFDRTMNVNVRGMYMMAIEAGRAMSEGGGGSIVCTASTTAWVGEEHQAIYHISKGAVKQIVRGLAVDMAPYGVRVNGIAPGSVLTPVVQDIVSRPEQWNKFRVHIPMDRAGEPAEIAKPIAFLLSDDASYITGHVLVADGGLTAGFRMSDWDAVVRHTDPRPPRRPAQRLERES